MFRRPVRAALLIAAALASGCDDADAPDADEIIDETPNPGPEAQPEPGPEGEPEPGPEGQPEPGPEPGPEGEPEPDPDAWTTERVYNALMPVCGGCHTAEANLPIFAALETFEDVIVADRGWIVPGEPEESVFLRLLEGRGIRAFVSMPPELAYLDMPPVEGRPVRADLVEWITNLEDAPGVGCWEAPGPTVLPRLNRTEYNNAVRALLGTESTPADDFPVDDGSQGLDNISGSLTISPLLVEKYDLAAAALAEEAIPDRFGAAEIYVLEGEAMRSETGRASGEYWNLWSNGDLSGDVELRAPGRYRVRAYVSGGQAGPDPVQFEVLVDGASLGVFETDAQLPNFAQVEVGGLELQPGRRDVTIRFLNDYYCPQERFDAGQCDALGDRNLLIDALSLEGPMGGNMRSTFENMYFGDCAFEPTPACTQRGVRRFARLAWRREIDDDTFARLWGLVEAELEESGDMRTGVRHVVHAILLSPNFLLRPEIDGEPGTPLSGHERATRLAAFLWRSVPDEALLDLARDGGLETPEQLQAAALRMLQDPRGAVMIDDLGAQWLLQRQAEVADPEYSLFPDFDEALRASMIEETRQVFAELWNGEHSLLDLVDADYTYVNGRLAQHYGIEGIEGDVMQRVPLPQAGRLGLLTHGSWLMATSHRTRTSPVKRGQWVLEELLCAAPPPPPPNVEGLVEQVDQNLPLRERMEQHRADPTCAACHRNMDDIGFGLEQFDAVGAFRAMDGDEVIDPTGILMGETPFEGGVSLARAVRAHPNLGPCMTDKVVTFALGRTLAREEHCLVEDIDVRAAAMNYRPDALVEAIVQSPLFTQRAAREEADQ